MNTLSTTMEDSSPDLSLKLRRGSSDSRDSFYMDFDKGIDSDIEEMAANLSNAEDLDLNETSVTTVLTAVHAGAGTTTASSASTIAGVPSTSKDGRGSRAGDRTSWPSIPPQNVSGGTTRSSALGGISDSLMMPSLPGTPGSGTINTTTTLATDQLLHATTATSSSSPNKAKSSTGHVQISALPPRNIPGPLALTPLSVGGGGGGSSTYYYPSHSHHNYPLQQQFPPIMRRLSRAEKQIEWRQLGADALATTLSALYGKLLVVMGTAFPMAEVISTYIPPSFYEVYYLYLYVGSMFFLLYMYIVLVRDKRRRKREEEKAKSINNKESNSVTITDEESDRETTTGEETTSGATTTTINSSSQKPSYKTNKNQSQSSLGQQQQKQKNYGSFYLRMGAVAFGIGSMIYSGLEFGQYFELESNTKCHNIFLALTPATRMAFIFIQMYFIFLNNEQMRVYKHKIAARFGLMHMIGTNLSVWLSVLVQETKHEILTFYNPENNSLRISHRIPHKNMNFMNLPTVTQDHPPEAHYYTNPSHHIITRGLKGPHHLYECRRTNIIGSLVQDASPFLFPCTIEYSLICAAILYVMWRNISKLNTTLKQQRQENVLNIKRSPHHYSVDCARAHKGLFVGILLLVLTIISLILFFVLISRIDFVGLAVIEVNICELTLYGLTTLATLIGMIQMRQLKYDGSRNLQLDNILLVGAQTGMFIYSTFTIIGGQFTIERNTVLVLVTALASLVQTTCQTIFILDASRRSCATPEQIRKKPGREIVTFLLVTNLAMWAINTLEKSRAESHPIQLHFYGLWAWTIITHVSMPLAIFYRFHSTVCLCEIWKRAYKMKPTYM